MRKSALVVFLCFSICFATVARQQPSSGKPETKVERTSDPKPSGPGQTLFATTRPPAARADDGILVPPADVNVHLESDQRMFVVMAALNAAGFDYEPAGESMSPARVELRKDLS